MKPQEVKPELSIHLSHLFKTVKKQPYFIIGNHLLASYHDKYGITLGRIPYNTNKYSLEGMTT